jgi:uncharacterized membrane protein
MGETHFAAVPSAVYGGVLLACAIAYYVLQLTIIRSQGAHSVLAAAVGQDKKGKLSPLIYLIAVLAAFVHPGISGALYALVALIWLIPDKRIERVLAAQQPAES